MENIVALFESALGLKQVKEIVEYRVHNGRRYAEFESMGGQRFLAYLDEIVIKVL